MAVAIGIVKYQASVGGEKVTERAKVLHRLSVFPTVASVRKLAVALIPGSSCIVKPPSSAPLSVLRLADFCVKAWIPGGAVTTVVRRTQVTPHDGPKGEDNATEEPARDGIEDAECDLEASPKRRNGARAVPESRFERHLFEMKVHAELQRRDLEDSGIGHVAMANARVCFYLFEDDSILAEVMTRLEMYRRRHLN